MAEHSPKTRKRGKSHYFQRLQTDSGPDPSNTAAHLSKCPAYGCNSEHKISKVIVEGSRAYRCSTSRLLQELSSVVEACPRFWTVSRLTWNLPAVPLSRSTVPGLDSRKVISSGRIQLPVCLSGSVLCLSINRVRYFTVPRLNSEKLYRLGGSLPKFHLWK